MANIQYYLNEEDNIILVSGSDTRSGMNALLTSSKNPNTNFDPNLTSKISSLGMNASYIVQNGNDTTEIPIDGNQELWVYRGYNQEGGTDGLTYRYNPHLHRPYKAYILTETGSGTPSNPYSPTGGAITPSSPGDTPQIPATSIPARYIEGRLSIVGNQLSSMSSSADSGSFIIYDDSREIHPFLWTQYQQLPSPPSVGANYTVYKEDQTMTDTGQFFNTSTSDSNPGVKNVKFNNSTISLVTELYITGTSTNGQVFGPLIQSITNGKVPGVIRVASAAGPNYVDFTVTGISQDFFSTYYKLIVEFPTPSSPFTLFSNAAAITTTLTGYPKRFADLQQSQNFYNNFPQQNGSVTFTEGTFSYTSSTFTQTDFNSQPCSGSTMFGLYADYDYYVAYTAENTGTQGNVTRIFFTGSLGSTDSRYFDLPGGSGSVYTALVGTVSASGFQASATRFSNGEYTGVRFDNTITNPSRPGTPPSDIFSSRWNDVYMSYSESISSSIDGLYVFNQLPQNDVQVTASVLIAPWTGSDSGSKYGVDTYAAALYGEGETGDGPTWQTASIRIYTGSYPNSVPTTLDVYLTESIYESAFVHTQSQGVPITMSFTIPSESISIKDCLSMALSVSSGSFNSASVENSLVVRNYSLEFFTPTQSGQGDGRVPTFIENAFSGTLGFSNTPDCQPLLNNITTERENRRIQIVEQQPTSSGFGGYQPLNFFQILSGSAEKSTVPESYYTQLSQINPRYNGSRTQANSVNSIEGLENGFGTLPVIDYQRAYFAYCDQVLDPYPVLNNVTQYNIKYLINDTGDALQPTLSPYTAFDVEGTWTEGEAARVGINQISGSSQFDQLNGTHQVNKVAKEPVAVLWSQTGANTTSSAIPVAGAPGLVSTFVAPFMSYNMGVAGRNFDVNNQNDKIIPLTNALSKAQTTNLFTFNTSSRYGYFDSGTTQQASSSIVSSLSTAPNGNIGGTPTPPGSNIVANYAAPGEFYFNKDYFAINGINGLSGTQLSDVYSFQSQFTFPSTVPKFYKTDDGGWNDSSDYQYGEVGHMYVRLQYTTSTGVSENVSWINMQIEQIETPIMRLHFPGNQILDLNLATVYGSTNAGLRLNNTQCYVRIDAAATAAAASQEGLDAYNAEYCTFIFNLRSAQSNTIRAERRYRWVFYQSYNTEPIEADRNYWNPNIRPQYLGSGTVPSAASNGPYITSNVVSSLGISSNVDGALNAPFWAFSASAGADVLDHIVLQADNGNATYGGEYYQTYLPYTASANPQFPGGLEPIDTTIPAYNIPWLLLIGDEIKFQNDENAVFTIIGVIPPDQTANDKLVLQLDRAIPASIVKDFFLIRRFRYSPNTVVLNSLFPYGSLITDQIQINNTLTNGITQFFDNGNPPVATDNDGPYYTSSMSSTSSIQPDYISKERPLAKKDNTPSGILFPEFPTALIELEPDKVITQLRDNKLIT